MSKHTIGGLAGMPAKEQRERRQRRENEVPWSERDDRGQVPRERPWRRSLVEHSTLSSTSVFLSFGPLLSPRSVRLVSSVLVFLVEHI